MSNEELVELYQQGNKYALESLINDNRGLVRKLAIKYNHFNKLLELDDLIQSGTIGLINAANKYNANLENKASFITYAFQYIEREIYNCVNGRGSKQVNNNKFYKTVKSLNVPVGEEEENELLDMIDSHDESMKNIEEQIYLNQLRKELDEAMMDSNTLREREVLKLHYGWNVKSIALSEIGEMLQISTERIRQIENMALRKIRNSKWGRIKGIRYRDEIIGPYRCNYKDVEKKLDLDKYFKGIDIKF